VDEGRARIGFWAVVVAAALLLSVGAASLPLLDPDESRFARTSVEMMTSGDLVVPTFEGRPRLVKPPLLHWIQVALFRLLGPTELAARLPSAAASLGSLLIVGWIARRRFGWEGALWAAATMATMPLVIAIGRLGTLDALLSVHILAAVALDIAEPEEVGRYRSLAIGCLLGLAFLAKGPVGVMLPLLMMLAGRTACGRAILPHGRSLALGVTGWCVVVLPWGLAFLGRIGPAETFEILRVEALARFFSGTEHVRPPWFVPAVVLAGTFPWFGPLVMGLVRSAVRRSDPASRTAVYAGAAFLVGALFFSFSRSQLANYVLPLAPFAGIVAVWELGQVLSAPRERVATPALLTGALGAAALGLWFAPPIWPGSPGAGFASVGGLVLGAGCLVGLLGLAARRPRWVWSAATAASALVVASALALLAPEIARRRTAAYLIQEVPGLRDASRPLVTVDMKVPSLTFYLDRVLEEVSLGDLEARIDRDDAPWYVFDRDDLSRAAPQVLGRIVEVGRQGKYVVFEEKGSPLTPPPSVLDEPGGGG